MIGLTYQQIIEKIQKEKGLSVNEIEIKVKSKLRELSDLTLISISFTERTRNKGIRGFWQENLKDKPANSRHRFIKYSWKDC